MYINEDKRENTEVTKLEAAAKSNTTHQIENGNNTQLVDNRPQMQVDRNIQALANNSYRTKQLKEVKQMAENSHQEINSQTNQVTMYRGEISNDKKLATELIQRITIGRTNPVDLIQQQNGLWIILTERLLGMVLQLNFWRIQILRLE